MGILTPEEEQELQLIKLAKKKQQHTPVKETISPAEYKKRLNESLQRDSHVYTSTRSKQIEKDLKEWRKKVGPRFAEAETENPTILDRVKRLEIGHGTHKTSIVMSGNLGVGKAQPLTEKILTLQGWKQFENIRQGDMVLSGKGTPTLVKAVHPVRERMVYVVTFHDGTTAEADGEHLWFTYQGHNRYRNITTLELAETLEEEHKIPTIGVVHIPDSIMLENTAPAVLEAYSENKSLTKTPMFAKAKKQVEKTLNIKTSFKNKTDWLLGLDEPTRKTITTTLFDNHGMLESKHTAVLKTDSKKLSEEILTILRSLGCLVTVSSKAETTVFTVSSAFNLFTNNKLYKPVSKKELVKKVVQVEAKGYAKTRCITVAAESHTYITSGYTMTHNTWLAHAYINHAIQSGAVTAGQIVADTETAILGKISSAGFRRVELLEELLHPKYKIYLIDDVGQGYFSNEQGRKEVWYELLDHVYAHDLTLILTTNKDFTIKDGKIAGSPALERWIGSAAYDRLRHIVGSDGVIIPGNVNRRPGVYERREQNTQHQQ